MFFFDGWIIGSSLGDGFVLWLIGGLYDVINGFSLIWMDSLNVSMNGLTDHC